MNNKDILDAFGDIDEDFLIHAHSKARKQKAKYKFLKIASLAACLGLVILGTMVSLRDESKPRVEAPIDISDIISQTTGYMGSGGETKNYTTIDGNSLEVITRSPIKDNTIVSDLPVYESSKVKCKTVFEAKVDKFTKKLERLGMAYQKERYNESEGDNEGEIFYGDSYSIDILTGDMRLIIETRDAGGIVQTTYRVFPVDSFDGLIKQSGEKVRVDLDESDESIYKKLSPTLSLMNTLFDRKYEFSYINRNTYYKDDGDIYYNVDATEKVDTIAEKMNGLYLDNISFCIWNDKNDGFGLAMIYYVEYDVKKIGDNELISLDEAEGLLKKGYTVITHGCGFCMSMSPGVDFSSYDAVEIVYNNYDVANKIIPLYAFYKTIGKNTFAVTYVPAVKVDGMDEYFNPEVDPHK